MIGVWTGHLRGSLYNGSERRRLWRAFAVAAALAVAFAGGGCSMTYQLDSLFGSSSGATGSTAQQSDATQMPPDADLAYTRAAVSEVMARGKKDASVPWENPRTGARGTVTPLASAYTQDGQICRNFLASYVNGGSASWLQGEACKPERGHWKVRSLKPWKSS